MIYQEREMEARAALQAASKMCAAARTAPKGKGVDIIHTLALAGEEKDLLADKMDEIGSRGQGGEDCGWFGRDARCVRGAQAVVLIGAENVCRGVPRCSYCGFQDCAACARAGGRCAFAFVDLGVASASAAAVAAAEHIDNRIMFSIGKAAAEMGYRDEDVMWLGIPLSVSGKNIFFDRPPHNFSA